MSQPKLGIDFDGVLHDSFELARYTLNRTLILFELRYPSSNHLKAVSEQWLKENFTTQWKVFFNRLQINESDHGKFHEIFREFERYNPLASLVPESREFLEVAITKFGKDNVVLISNNQEAIIKKFFSDNNLPNIKLIATPHGKVQTLKDEKITIYIGDIIDDGKAAIAAGCKFIGLAHHASFGSDIRMSLFAQYNRQLGVIKVNSLKEAANYILKQ